MKAHLKAASRAGVAKAKKNGKMVSSLKKSSYKVKEKS
jgi:hypothetical protein